MLKKFLTKRLLSRVGPHADFNPPGRSGMTEVCCLPVFSAHMGSRAEHTWGPEGGDIRGESWEQVRPCPHKTLLALGRLCSTMLLEPRPWGLWLLLSLGLPFPLPNFLGSRLSPTELTRLQTLSSGYNHHPMACHSGPPRQPALWAEKFLPSKRVDLCPKPDSLSPLSVGPDP